MEKSTAGKYRKRLIGLLIAAFVTASAYAQLSYEAVRSLRFHQKNDYIYSLTNEEFYVNIENVSPNDVSVYMNSIPDNVELVSIKKETYIPPLESTNSSYGTHIVITVRFLKSGNYKLFSCDLMIKGKFYQIPFNPVHVFENVQMIKPSLSVSFGKRGDNAIEAKEPAGITVSAGSHVQYTVYVQFAAEVQGVSWTIPENSLFEQVSEYDVPKIPANEQNYEVFSEFRPVATFDWCPLSVGVQKLPAVSVVATALNGSTSTLAFPSCTVRVTPAEQASSAKTHSAASDFKYTFDVPDFSFDSEEKKAMSDNLIAEYCALLSKERNSLPLFSDSAKNRFEFEKNYNLSSHGKLYSKPLFFVFIALVFVFIVLCFLFCILRENFLFLIFTGLLCFFMGASIFYGLRINRKYAVVTGEKLLSIPETDNSTGMVIQKGSLVIVKKHSSADWLYVEAHDTYGWIKKENVIFIE